MFHLSTFFREPVGSFSTWVISPDNLSPYQEICSTRKVFIEKVSCPFTWFLIYIQLVFNIKQSDWQQLLWLVLPYIVSLPLYGLSKFGMSFLSNTCYMVSAINSLALLHWCYYELCIHIRIFRWKIFTEIPLLNRNEKVNCDNYGTQITQHKLALHKESCSAWTLFCTQCPNFSTKSQNDLTYDIVKKHSAPKPVVTFNWKLRCQEIPGFYALCQARHPTWLSYQMLMRTISTTKVMMRILKRSCAHVNISWWILSLKEWDTKC